MSDWETMSDGDKIEELKTGQDVLTEKVDNLEAYAYGPPAEAVEEDASMWEGVVPAEDRSVEIIACLKAWAAEEEPISAKDVAIRLEIMVDCASPNPINNATPIHIAPHAKTALKALGLYDGRDLAAVLCCLKYGCEAAYGELASTFGDYQTLPNGNRVYNEKNVADAVSALGDAFYKLGMALGGPGNPVRPDREPDTSGSGSPSTPIDP